jgi:hypothetical protein
MRKEAEEKIGAVGRAWMEAGRRESKDWDLLSAREREARSYKSANLLPLLKELLEAKKERDFYAFSRVSDGRLRAGFQGPGNPL